MIEKLSRHIVIVCLLIFAISCKDAQKKTSEASFLKMVINQKAINVLDFNKVIDDYSIIPLESNDQCLIGNIDKVIFSDDQIFILDKNIAKTVFVFDKREHF
jgi:hypothetical protein